MSCHSPGRSGMKKGVSVPEGSEVGFKTHTFLIRKTVEKENPLSAAGPQQFLSIDVCLAGRCFEDTQFPAAACGSEELRPHRWAGPQAL